MTSRIIIEDSGKAMCEQVESESIDLIVTSPPYGSIREYNGHSGFDFEFTAREMFRVLKQGGILVWNIGVQVVDGSEGLDAFKHAIFFVEECGFRLHDTMLYAKLNGAKPDRSRYNQCFEYLFVLSKGKPATVNLIKDKPNVTAGRAALGRWTVRQKDGSMKEREYRKEANDFGVRPNIWVGKTRGQEDMCEALPHPAMMPKWLARDLILSYSNVGDTVLDPYAGSGTVGMQCVIHNRNVILIDKDPTNKPIMERYLKVQPEMFIPTPIQTRADIASPSSHEDTACAPMPETACNMNIQ